MTAGRLAAIAIAVLLVGILAYWAFAPRPVSVDVATIARGTLEVAVEEEGVTRIREVYEVSSPVPGRTVRSPVEIGDPVVGGETVVAVIEPAAPTFLDARSRLEAEAQARAAEAALRLAEAELVRAEAERAFWQAEVRRDETLVARRAISEQALERTRLESATRVAAVATAEANVEVRRQEAESARATLIDPVAFESADGAPTAQCCLPLIAPVTGRVLDVVVESRQSVAAGTTLVTLGDPRDLEIMVELLSADAVRVRPGDVARITRWGGAGDLKAHVRRVEPAGFTKVSALGIEEQRVRVLLDIDSPPDEWSGLGHDYRVFVAITVWRGKDVVAVPMGALFREGNRWAVFVVQGGVARLIPIEIGERNTHAAVVVSGLAPGDQVLLHPSDQIADGVAVIDRATEE